MSFGREILKWLQSLDLSYPVKNPKRDFSNGFSIAEIFSRYYPSEVSMHSYDTGISVKSKIGNWELLAKFFAKHSIPVSPDLISDIIHSKNNAAIVLVETLYELLTNKRLPSKTSLESESPDSSSSPSSPHSFAKPTASQLIKDSVPTTQLNHMKNPQQFSKLQAEAIVEKQKAESRFAGTNNNSNSSNNNLKTAPASSPSASNSKDSKAAAKKGELKGPNNLREILGTNNNSSNNTASNSGVPNSSPAVPQRLSAPRPVGAVGVGNGGAAGGLAVVGAGDAKIEFKEVHIKQVDVHNLYDLRNAANNKQQAE